MNDITKPKMIVIENILKGLIVFKTVSCEYGDSIPVSIECLVREAPICKDKYDYYLYLYFSVGKYTESIGGGPIEGLFKGQTDTEEADQIIHDTALKYIEFWETQTLSRMIAKMPVNEYLSLIEPECDCNNCCGCDMCPDKEYRINNDDNSMCDGCEGCVPHENLNTIEDSDLSDLFSDLPDDSDEIG